MAVITAANSPYQFKGTPAVLGVNMACGGTVLTEIAVNGTWINTGDVYPQGAHPVPLVGTAEIQLVVTGGAVVEVYE